MIKTNEVREGNLITRSNPAAATKILTVYNVEKASQRIGIIDLLGFDGFVFCENAEGITLTPEIFEKLGFEYREHLKDYFLHINRAMREILLIRPTTQITKLVAENGTGIKIKYVQFVHELQNLHFSLLGVELDVKNLLK